MTTLSRIKAALLRSVLMLLLALLSTSAFAQLTTGDIVGTVTDASGGVIPNAKVTITNLGTHSVRIVTSSESGDFTATLLEPGHYSVVAESSGFKAYKVADLQLGGGDRSRVDPKLEAGGSTETVEVTAEDSVLQADSSTVQSTVTERAVQDLPLNGRNFVNLVQIQPGVNQGNTNGIGAGGAPDDRRQSSSVSANGQSDLLNNNLVDGLDNNEREQGVIGVRPSIDSISEVKIVTNNASAEVGRAAGAVVNVLTKSGTNSFHGSAFEYFRNDIFDSRNFFSRGGAKPELRLNQYGGSIGGPIFRDKTFFFGAFEGYRRVQGDTYTTTVPTLYEEQNPGDFSDIGGGTLTAAQINPVSLTYFKMYPAPNTTGVHAGGSPVPTSNYQSSPAETQNSITTDVRVDHHFNANNSVYGHYSYNPVKTNVAGAFPGVTEFGKTIYNNGAPSFTDVFSHIVGPSNETSQAVALDYLHIFGANLLVDLKAGFNRINIASLPLNYGTNISAQLGIVNGNLGTPDTSGVPTILFFAGPYGMLGDGFFVPINDVNNTFQYNGVVTYTHGAHNFRAGAAFIRRELNYFQDSWSPQGGFAFFSIQSFLEGQPGFSYRGNLLTKPGYRTSEPSFFVQDDWHATKTLTVNAGVRYEVFTPFTEAHNQYSNFDPASVSVKQAGQGISSSLNVGTTYTNIAPRIGFAKTLPHNAVLRGGFGLTNFPVDYAGAIQNANPPDDYSCFPCFNSTFPAVGLPAVGSLTNPSGSLSYKAPSYRTAYIEQFNLTVEKEFAGFTATASYVGELGRHQSFITDINRPAPPGAGNPEPSVIYATQLPNVTNIAWFTNAASSNYNALQTSITSRAKKGLTLSANYTLAHGLTNGTPEGTSVDGAGLIPSKPGYDYGESQLDIRHRAAVVVNYKLPFGKNLTGPAALAAKGWQLNELGYWQTGAPFTVLDGSPQLNIPGISNDRPNEVGSAHLANKSITEWFDVTSFPQQTLGTAGNEARNELRGPHDRRVDLSLFKDFPIYREAVLQFRAECFNISNTPNFTFPNSTEQFKADGTLDNTTGFGTISSTLPNELPRQWQFALKATF
jgi:hypothetical protein